MLSQKEFVALLDGVTQFLLATSKDISENGATEEHRQDVGELINRSNSLHGDWLKLSSDEDVHSESSQGPKFPAEIQNAMRRHDNALRALSDRFHEIGYSAHESLPQRQPPSRLSDEAQQILPSQRATCEATRRNKEAEFTPEDSAKGSDAGNKVQATEGAHHDSPTTSHEDNPENDHSLVEAFAALWPKSQDGYQGDSDTETMDLSEKGQKSSDDLPFSQFEEMCLKSLQEECKRVNKYVKRYGNGKAKAELEAIFKVEGIWHDKEDVRNVDMGKASLNALFQVQDVLMRHVPSFTWANGTRYLP